MTLRRIITKLIIRVGTAKVRFATAKEHLSLVTYVERARRKKLNIKERAKMLVLMGKKVEAEEGKKVDSDSDSDSDPDDKNDQQMESDLSDDSSDESEDEDRGQDLLQSSRKLDIPVVRDIPILSQLAKKEKAAQAPKVAKSAPEVM